MSLSSIFPSANCLLQGSVDTAAKCGINFNSATTTITFTTDAETSLACACQPTNQAALLKTAASCFPSASDFVSKEVATFCAKITAGTGGCTTQTVNALGAAVVSGVQALGPQLSNVDAAKGVACAQGSVNAVGAFANACTDLGALFAVEVGSVCPGVIYAPVVSAQPPMKQVYAGAERRVVSVIGALVAVVFA
ncbi:hypothetical protein BC830DRAFT_1152254 [Chytriomyces sp. MP71]|nr:hypothetical protein BC830DRAFT_1152254 [Chytriomyces sp. MP71]